MGNVVAANFYPYSYYPYGYYNTTSVQEITNTAPNDGHQVIWKLTRTMKAAGWIHKASGIGHNSISTIPYKIPAASATPSNDLWNGIGDQVPGQTGTDGYYATGGTGTYACQISGLSGMTSASVGRILILAGSSRIYESSNNSALYENNGAFRIVELVSSTSVKIHNPAGFADINVTNLYWSERDVLATVPGQTGTTAGVSFDGVRIVTVTGLTGMTPMSTNRFLTLTNAAQTGNNGTFKILRYISSSSVTIINPLGVSGDTNNGAINWKETDPLLEQYATLQYRSWICMQGPSTLKIPITSQSTGTFIKGENVTQASTGAKGELLGYHWDSSAGYLVVMPRVDGSGGGVHGWTTSVVTGDLSSASVTPSANVIEFVRECVFYLNGYPPYLSSLTAYIECVDQSSESPSRFSYMSDNGAGCTSEIAPGHSGTNNTFPTLGAYSWSSEVGAYSPHHFESFDKFAFIFSVHYGYTHLMCADATYDSGRSADGSFACAISASFVHSNSLFSPNNSSYIGFVWTRCDDQEEGDVDPYVMWNPLTTTNSNGNLYAAGITATSPGTYGASSWSSYKYCDRFNAAYVPQTFFAQAAGFGSGGVNGNVFYQNHQCSGWRRRGLGAGNGDAFQGFGLASIGYVPPAFSFASNGTGFLGAYTFDEPYLQNKKNFAITLPLWVVSAQSLKKMRKGTLRWMRMVDTGQTGDFYLGGKFIQLSSSMPAYIVGPWDGFSIAMK